MIRLNKKGLTLIEVLIALLIFSAVAMLSISILTALSRAQQASIENYKNRTVGFENLLYLIHEIQSADTVDIEDEGKTLKVHYIDGRKDIEYRIEDGTFKIDGLELFYVNDAESEFSRTDELIRFKLHTRSFETLETQRELIIDTQIMIRKLEGV